MDIIYNVNEPITAEEVIFVFRQVGWSKNPADIISAFKGSYYIAARHQGKLIGFARAISDGYYYTGIYDVVVLPDYQKQGIGYNMMNMLLNKFDGQYIFLTYTDGNEPFYEKCGFKKNDNSMWISK